MTPFALRREIAASGYAFISEYRPNDDIIEIANNLGDPLTPWEGGLVQVLVPREQAEPNTYSGNFGLGRFPFHTDLAHWRRPPRYLLLRCLVGRSEVPTLLIDGRELVEALPADTLARALFKTRRPCDRSLALLRLFEPASDGADLLRWDELFLRPASTLGETAYAQTREWLANRAPNSATLVYRGDTLVIDNWRMLHARASIPLGCTDRSVQRVYLGGLN